ncbi:rho-associated protein kinase 1-like [Thrips palmi]|uniref:Rho-associated protein kinase 1-like n=1 Tax=Thrips palmi TaxID=161013 RepID=A0A6P9A8P0_THRPL|nr:rho-associated protein kinase 1-like [Thrips palmi]
MSKLYCYCRRESDNRCMIFCELCTEWFHFECVGVVETNIPKGAWYCKWCERIRKVKSSLVKTFHDELVEVKADLTKKFNEEVAKVRAESNQQVCIQQEVQRLQQQVTVLLEEKRDLINQNKDKEYLLLQLKNKETAMVTSEQHNNELIEQISTLKQNFSQEKQQLQIALERSNKEYESAKIGLAEATLKLQSMETAMLAFEKEKHVLQQLSQDLNQEKQRQERDLEILAKENEELKEKLAAARKRGRLSLSQKI